MLTYEQYIKWFENKKKQMEETGLYKSEIKFLFHYCSDYEYSDGCDWYFDTDNWNGGDILRSYFWENYIWDHPRKCFIGDYQIVIYCIDDEWTIFILCDSEFYEIQWYKTRGRTESIKKNGEYITLQEYVDLYNKIVPDELQIKENTNE